VVRPSLVLTVTRQCNLRCSYCPTAKDGWPVLTKRDIRRAFSLFHERYGEGDVKLFGGEPLLEPGLVRCALEEALKYDGIQWIYLSTNGLGLDQGWIDYLREYPKAILTISMDGRPADHRRMRRALPGTNDAYDHLVSIMEPLLRLPRVVATQTIAPSMAGGAYENFLHLCSLGFWRFNFLPGYYLPWRAGQLSLLSEGFSSIRSEIERKWLEGERLYVRNLFVRAPTPFFNTGFIVDSDATIHPSNLGLSGKLDHLREQTQCGDLDSPPSAMELSRKAMEVNGLLERELAPGTWQSTLLADAELTRFCGELMPAYLRHRRSRERVA
jgi:sulfatase maturation enzyme AslB (radical SAM superfamily)